MSDPKARKAAPSTRAILAAVAMVAGGGVPDVPEGLPAESPKEPTRHDLARIAKAKAKRLRKAERAQQTGRAKVAR